MRYMSLLISLALVAGLVYWYLKSGSVMPNSDAGVSTTPQQTMKQAEDSAKLLQQSLQQQQQQLEQAKPTN